MSSHLQSSGRGGAGNIVDASKTPPLQPADLKTPTLKTSMVTTGRGGTGNFAANLDADEKRRRQDVEPVVRRQSHGAQHIGRGGTGNVVKAGDEQSSSTQPGTATSTSDKRKQQPGSPPLSDTGKEQGSPRVGEERGLAGEDKTVSPLEGGPLGGERVRGEDSDGDVAVPAARPEETVGWAEKGRNLLFGKK
ncbi:hypothetical protein B0J18DRAFT_19838 [Chaetomium sp. MPI-SDFR-AT-0129]|nr:hypothetical protein B0J18DRAFT_19838 [Chaetomium sp. MPI-SDFR-AT-0129]